MNKEKRKRILSAIALCTVSATLLAATGCGKPGGKKKSKIAVITKNSNVVSFWDEVKNGAEDAGDELGYEIVYTIATGDNDFATQVDAINKAVDEGVEAIIIAPNSQTELNEALAKAQAKDIKIININSKIDEKPVDEKIPSVDVLSLVSSSDRDGGYVAARYASSGVLNSDYVADEVKNILNALQSKEGGVNVYTSIENLGRGMVGIIPHTAATAADRVNGFKEATKDLVIDEIKKDFGKNVDESALKTMVNSDAVDKYFVVADGVSSIEDAEKATTKLLEAADCNIKCIFATNTNTTIGACKAVEALGKSDTVYVIGFNSDEQELAFIRTGVLKGTVVQNPYNMGYVAVRYAKKALEGENVPKQLDTGVTWVDAKNMNEEYIQLLLHPENY